MFRRTKTSQVGLIEDQCLVKLVDTAGADRLISRSGFETGWPSEHRTASLRRPFILSATSSPKSFSLKSIFIL